MWIVLSDIFKNYKIIFLESTYRSILEDKKLKGNFTVYKNRGATSLLIFEPFFNQDEKFFIKLFKTKLFTKNRIKKLLKTFKLLEKFKIPFIKPILVFYLPLPLAIFKRLSFYGGAIYPYISWGFLKSDYLKNLKKENPKTFLNLIKNLVMFLFNLHEKGIFLRDTKYNNFWYDNEKQIFKIFDLDGIKFFNKPLFKNLRLKDLATLSMSLEWIFNNYNERKKIFDLYQTYYPSLSIKDFQIFEKLVNSKHQKRKKSLKLFSFS